MLTGATGYLGRAVAEHLLEAGYHVQALVRDPADLDLAGHAGLVPWQGDLEDRPSLEAAARGADAVVHVAGLTNDWAADPRLFHRVNAQGTGNVLEAARRARVPRVLATSTVMVFGPTDGLPAANEGTQRPNRAWFLPYQRSKARALELCREARSQGLDVRVVYPGALYGEGPLTPGNYLARVMQHLLEGAYPMLPRTSGARWCLAHVDDVARGHLLALERGDPCGEYILGGDNIPFDRMLEAMRDGLALPRLPSRVPGPVMMAGLGLICAWSAITGTEPPISLGGGRALLHEWCFSSEHARRELGYSWRPFAEAFPRFVSWYADRARHRGSSHAADVATARAR